MSEVTVKILKPGLRVVKINRGRDGIQGPQGPPGDMTGPLTSEVGNIAIFATTGGNVLQDSGATLDDFALAANVTLQLELKQDAEVGKGLSTNDYTDEDKAKIDALSSGGYRGAYFDLDALVDDIGEGEPGDYALVTPDPEADPDPDPEVEPEARIFYFWDEINEEWAPIASSGGLTGADIATLLFAQPDTNNFTDDDQTKLDESVSQAEVLELIATAGTGAVIDEATNARTLSLGDVGKYIYLTNVSGCTVTLPNDTTVLWTGNPEIELWVQSTVAPTIALGAGVTVNNLAKPKPQYSTIRLKRVAANTWNLSVF